MSPVYARGSKGYKRNLSEEEDASTHMSWKMPEGQCLGHRIEAAKAGVPC
jgi:hypothetical protein